MHSRCARYSGLSLVVTSLITTLSTSPLSTREVACMGRVCPQHLASAACRTNPTQHASTRSRVGQRVARRITRSLNIRTMPDSTASSALLPAPPFEVMRRLRQSRI